MKFLTGAAVAAALVVSAAAANAQAPAGAGARYMAASDLEGPSYGPYAEPELPAPPPRYGYGYGRDYGYQPAPALLPAEAVYAMLRENGFSPLGIPHLRGFVYTVAVIDPRGDDGHLVVDARDGRIVRFIPAYGIGPAFEGSAVVPYAAHDAMPPPMVIRGVPRPPAPIPHVASRTVPVPRAAPQRGDVPVAAARSASTRSLPPERSPQPSVTAQARPQAAAIAAVPARPALTILPTQEMPPVQGLE